MANAQEVTGEETLYAIHAVSRIDGDRDLLARLAAARDSLDSGHDLWISFGGLLGNTPIVEIDEGATFMDSAGEAGIDFILPSAQEFAYGIERLRELDDRPASPRILAANIVDEQSRRPLFARYTVTNLNNRRVLVIGMADPGIIRDSEDEDVVGIDVIPFDEAMRDAMIAVALEQPDIIAVAGKLNRDAVIELARRFRIIDFFITDDSESFTVAGTVSAASAADTPVYFAQPEKGYIASVARTRIGGVETVEVSDISIDEEYPPDPVIESRLNNIIGQLERRRMAESVIEETGDTVTSILYDMFDVDAVFIERQSLYYYSIEDSLNVTNVEKVIKPYNILKTYDLKGEEILSILERNKNAPPDQRLHIAGVQEDAKIDSIPIQEDRDYVILTTTFLRMGGNGYEQFTRGTAETETATDMLTTVEQYLVAREERIREALKPKYWELNLHLDIGSYLNKQDVNREKEKYGNNIPKPFRNQEDNFIGNLKIESWNNTFKYARKRHQYDITLHMKYVRAGNRNDEGDIVYREADDNLILYNKYTYTHPDFIADPYIDNTINSELYSGPGKHPINAKVTAGLTRKFPLLFNMVLNMGLSADRNYVTNVNGIGIDSKITFDKTLEGDSYIARKTTLHSETIINYKPMARYHMAFYLQNRNKLSINLMSKIDMAININSYAYRDTTLRKVAIGVFYDFSLNYAMDWNF